MTKNVWDKLAVKYDKLWVQKYSLQPTRDSIIKIIKHIYKNENKTLNILDIGCGTGQLIFELNMIFDDINIIGIDNSETMLKISRDKNPGIRFIKSSAENLKSKNKFDIIICSHSFPYYKNKKDFPDIVLNLLSDGGTAIFIQSSINNIYDKIVYFIVELTAEKADYLSIKDFKKIFRDKFKIKTYIIKEIFFMPTIAGFIMRKKDENIID